MCFIEYMNFHKLIGFLVAIILLSILSAFYPTLTGNSIVDYDLEEIKVLRIIDGDTIDSSIGKIRLLGINTPERGDNYYNEAKDFLEFLQNKSILALRDFEDEDRYNRKLRYLYYNNMNINTKILENGLATLFMNKGLSLEKELIKAENSARNKAIGLWEKSNNKCSTCFELIELNEIDEYFILKNNCNFQCTGIVRDSANHEFSIEIKGYNEKRYESKGKIWNNNGDRFFLRDNNGKLMLFYEY